jgi:hypothetical protein
MVKFGTETGVPLVTYGETLLIIAGSKLYNSYRALLNTGYSIGIDEFRHNGRKQ